MYTNVAKSWGTCSKRGTELHYWQLLYFLDSSSLHQLKKRKQLISWSHLALLQSVTTRIWNISLLLDHTLSNVRLSADRLQCVPLISAHTDNFGSFGVECACISVSGKHCKFCQEKLYVTKYRFVNPFWAHTLVIYNFSTKLFVFLLPELRNVKAIIFMRREKIAGNS